MNKGVFKMTADAKVGLLLGLVFIVIIAFLVNGLPSFLQSASAEDVVINTITPPTGPDLVIDDRVMDTARQLQPEMRFRQSQPPQDVVLLNPQNASPAAAVEPVMPPAPVEPVQPVETAVARTAEVSAPAAASTPQVTYVTPAASSSETTAAVGSTAAPKGRVHVIQNGETLSSIAQKYYGKEEGNRRAVIQKLYEANRKVLTSQDKVRVGDKLTIPPLTDAAGGSAVASKTPEASQTLLTKFSTMLERPAKEDQKQITEYTVKQGDSLWSIAQRMLGDGKRYKEIIQANQDKIKDADDLTAGMSLKIPK
jgi:nucleoid-associated protein YgaU